MRTRCSETARLCILEQVTSFKVFLPTLPASWVRLRHTCIVWDRSVCKVTHGWCHARVTPGNVPPWQKCTSFRDIPCLTVDSIMWFRFPRFCNHRNHNSVIHIYQCKLSGICWHGQPTHLKLFMSDTALHPNSLSPPLTVGKKPRVMWGWRVNTFRLTLPHSGGQLLATQSWWMARHCVSSLRGLHIRAGP